MPTTFERLRLILVRDYKADPDRLAPDTPLDSLNIDSLGIAELLFTIEDEFQVKLTKEPVEMATVADVVGFVDRLVAIQHGVDAPGDGAALPSARS